MKYKVGDIVFSTIWRKFVLIKDIRPNRFYLIADLEYLSRTMITYESNLKSREDDIEKDMEEHQKIVDEIMTIQGIEPIEAEIEEVWHCPDGYVFKDEHGNVINATKIVLEKKKKEYPKTYEECLNVLGYDDRETYCIFHTGADERLFEALYRLKVCRDAYWKLYGEEMGLGKPWEPDWTDLDQWKYCIWVDVGEFITMTNVRGQHILAFPTEEMRDAFKENFDPDIEICKEFL